MKCEDDTIMEVKCVQNTKFTKLEEKLILQYELVTTEAYFSENFDEYVYSLLIVLYDDGISVESKFVYDISRDFERAWDILNSLAKGAVMPATAIDIIYDILAN